MEDDREQVEWGKGSPDKVGLLKGKEELGRKL